MPFAEIDKLKIYYEVQGDGEPIILIHDLLEDHLHWSYIQNELSNHFKVIVLDLRGSGQSTLPKSPFSLEDLAKDVIALADLLKLEKFHLIGDSLGGSVAQTVAHKFPDRVDRMVLTNSFLKLSNSTRWFLETLDDLFKEGQSYFEIFKLALPWFYSCWFLGFEKEVSLTLDQVKKRKHPLKQKGYQLHLEALKEFDSTRWVTKIKAPTLLIIGEEDIFCLFKDSRALLSKLKEHKVELCSGGHKSKAECPTRFLEVVSQFLKD